MNWQNAALGMAGLIGSCVAVLHGVLVQRLMVVPFERSAFVNERTNAPIRRLVPLLLHFSTVSWLLGGLALIAAANWFERDAKLSTGISVGSMYFCLVKRIYGRLSAPVACQGHDTTRFP